MAREIIHEGLHHQEFIDRATSGFDSYRAGVEPYTLEYAERETGIPAERDPRGRPRLCQG